MSRVNVLVAFNETGQASFGNFIDNFRFEDHPDDAGKPPEERRQVRKRNTIPPLRDKQGRELDSYKLIHPNLDTAGMFKPFFKLGQNTHVVSVYIDAMEADPDAGDGKLLVIEGLKQVFPGKATIIGVWNSDGSQWGTHIVPATYDEAGNELTPETVEGTPVYPVDPDYMKWMPDDVTYDADGNEVSRTPAAAFKQVNLLQGHKPRRL